MAPSLSYAATQTSREPNESMKRLVVASLAVLGLLLGGFGGWAATTSIGSAVIASGTVVVDSNIKKVQHPTGGVIGEIRVREGDSVASGDVVARLDETITLSNLLIVTKQLDQIAIRQARLKSERDGLPFKVPPILEHRRGDSDVAAMILDEQTLFNNRSSSRDGQKSQLRERITQLREEITGLGGQQNAKEKEIDLVRMELQGQKELWDKKLMAVTKYTATQREAARLEGELGAILSRTAQSRGRIAEIELQILQINQEMRAEVSKELRDLQGKEAELSERKVAAQDQLKRVDIRAPQSGVVHQLAIHTVGGTISPNDVMMVIVPGGDELVIDARVAPQDIDHVKKSKTAHIRFVAFNQQTTPEVEGTLQRVSADITRDPSGQMPPFYTARITLPATSVRQLGELKLLPGMPAEVQIKTGERTALSYFVKPLQDQWARTFREQ
jgi:HlyD family secretion protein